MKLRLIVAGFFPALCALAAIFIAANAPGLPPHLGALREPLRGVTELYVRAAYGGDALADADRRTAIDALAAVERKAAEAG